MATTSEISVGLDDMARIITDQREVLKKAKINATNASTALAEIPTKYADVIASINALGTSNAYEAVVKAQFAKMVTEFNGLKTKADGIAAVDLTT